MYYVLAMSELITPKKNDRPGWKWSYLVLLLVQFTAVFFVYSSLLSKGFLVPPAIYWLVSGMALLTVVLMVLGILKKNISYIWWEALLLVFAFCGVWILCLAILPLWAAVILAGLITVIPYIWPLTLWHDLTFTMGVLGVGLFLAIRFPMSVLLVSSVGIVLYEYIRQNQVQLATLFAEAFRVGLPPGLLLPSRQSGWFKPIERTWQAGTGIVVGLLPIIFISALSFRVARHGWFWLAGLICLESILGGFWGQDRQGRLRSWFFLAIAVGFYAFIGALQL